MRLLLELPMSVPMSSYFKKVTVWLVTVEGKIDIAPAPSLVEISIRTIRKAAPFLFP